MHYVFADTEGKNALPHAVQARSHNAHVQQNGPLCSEGHKHMHPMKDGTGQVSLQMANRCFLVIFMCYVHRSTF